MAENQERNEGSNAVTSSSNADESPASGPGEKRKKAVEKKRPKHVHVCEVKLLDGTELVIEVEKNADGEFLFSKVVEKLDIIDKEYFGLRFTRGSEPTKCWLVLQKQIRKQLNIGELKFQFAVKFYEPEPGKHLDEYTRYLLYLQLREDIVYGRLACPARTYMLLASFTAQAEFGDYDANEHGNSYLEGYQLGPEEVENDPKFMSKVIELHKEHRGQTPAEAELNFLEVAKRTPRYGVDIHYAKNKKDDIEVGVSYKGIFVYQGGEPVDSYGWKAIDLVAYKRKKFMLKLFRSEKRKNPRFRLKGRRESKNLYKSAIEHHAFFRLTNSDRSKRRSGSLFIGSKFRYSDRTLYQIRSDPSVHDRQHDLKFARSPSKRQKVKSRRDRKPDSNDTTEKVEVKAPDNLVSEMKKTDEDYEEIELDQPYDDRYEWIIVEKVLPDGSKREYRRRVVSTTATTVTETTYVIRKGTEEEGHMMEEKPIETPRKDEVTLVKERIESPEIYEKEEVKVDESDKSRQEVIVTTIVTEEAVTKPDGDDVEEPMSLTDVRAASKKPSAAVKPLMRDDIGQEAKSNVTETTTTTTKVLVYDVDKEETIKIVSKEERERELREREKQREIEEEQRRQDEIRARNEREAATRRKWKEQEEERKQKEEELQRKQKEEEEEKIRREKAMSPELQEISLSTGNEEFDKEFGIKGMDTFLIKTSPMPSSFMKDLEEELSHSLVDNDDIDNADGGLNEENVAEEEKKESTLIVPVIEEPRKAKTLDRKFIRRPPPERSSGYIRRSYGNELDFDYSYGSRTMPRKPRKYVPLITKEELVRAYSSGGLHDESIIRSKQEPQEDKSKIEYSLKDESGVEQGQQGFVKNLIGRHETIKLKEDEEVEEQRRSRVYSSSDDVKLFVPTRTASFGNVEKPETKKTKVPPPVKTKPVVFAADRSGLNAVVVTRPVSAIELSSSPDVAEANFKETGQPSNSNEVRKYSFPEVTTSTVVFDSSVPLKKKTTSGLIDKSSVEPLWGKVVLKQRRSFKGSDSFDVTSNFELLTMREQGLLPDNHGSKSRELFVINFAEPEVILDEKSRVKINDIELGFEKHEHEADENDSANRLILNDLTPEETPNSLFVCNELDEWSPSDYIDKGETNEANQRIVEEKSLEMNLVDEVFCGFEKFEEIDAIGNQMSNKVRNYISSDKPKSITDEISNEVSIITDDPNTCESDFSCDPCESHDESYDQVNDEDLGFIGSQNDQVVESVEKCVAHVTARRECGGDGRCNEIDLVSERNEKATKEEENINGIVVDNILQVNEECVGKYSNIDDKNNDRNNDENIDNEREKLRCFCQKEIVGDNVVENEKDLPSKDKIDVKEVDRTAEEEDAKSEISCHGGDKTEAVEAWIDGSDGGNIFLVKTNAFGDVQIKEKASGENEDDRSFQGENQFDEKVEVLEKKINTDRYEINDEKCPNEEARYRHRHERIRFDSCPDLGVYIDSNFDDVFSNGRSFKRASTTKEKKSKNSYSKLKKQTQRRKPASDSNQLAISKSLSLSMNSELGRLKKEYDASLAAFLRQRSKSLDDVIVATQTIAVSPVDQAESSDVTGSPIVTPPPPDVINHSDSILTASPDVTDDAFPTPPPDVITQTMAISPTATTETTTTTIVTEEVVQSHQNPPEVETHTVILSGDGISKEDFERMISNESVTTSETTVSKVVKTEVTTVSSGQRIIITGEGEINEDLQQALANAAVGNGE